MLLQLLLEHCGISFGRQRQERFGEAGTELRCRLSYPCFRSRHLGGVAALKVLDNLFRIQFCQGRQDSKSIASQEEDISRMTARAGGLAVSDVGAREGPPRSLGELLAVEIRRSRERIHRYILQYATKSQGIPDL